MANYKLPERCRATLAAVTFNDLVAKLPDITLDRDAYDEVKKALENAGGKWTRKLGGFLFPDDPRPRIANMLGTGIAIDEPKLFQSFYTPPELAKRVVELADIGAGEVVLEPSAGEGAIVNAIFDFEPRAIVTAVELNPVAYRKLVHKGGGTFTAYNVDFLNRAALKLRPGDFDKVVMNPPFSHNQDIQHVKYALSLVRPGGRLVAIMSPNVHRQGFIDLVRSHDYDLEEVPAGTFSESGTPIATVIVNIRKSE